ncbi:hypothetical protein [Parafrankia sp. EUN1f]|uniref:hypothetical protein n=1 Tax=Parafrankia sp. EUN1f TaxID=102897 RepID=UPI0001C452E7|nr:hypothetical protein [Parafrankia sp. EUN1f]EFC79012.1 hypothetical protein FrEUN1fDRAFT_7863 [Parafrankia sp. EUN1f]
MPWVHQVPADPHGYGRICSKPDSNRGAAFGPGSVWQCDACGRRWRFIRWRSEQRDSWDEWTPEPASETTPPARL